MITALIVDDDMDMRNLGKLVLVSLGCEVLLASSGQQALELAFLHNPSIILMDILMPILDGHLTTKLLRQQGYTGFILMVSALSKESEYDKSIASGADAYERKPMFKRTMKPYIDALVKLEASK